MNTGRKSLRNRGGFPEQPPGPGDRFRRYTDPRDWLTVFRAVLHLPGSVRRDGACVRVTLRPPDPPRVRRALAAMLDDINRTDARLFGTGPTLRFELAE